MYVFLILLSSILLAQAQVANQVPLEIEKLDKECNAGVGLACAKAAYIVKKADAALAYEYYQKGCDLKDNSACYNMKSLDPREIYFKKADGVMKYNSTNISNCHVPDLKNKRSQTQLKEVWHRVSIRVHIGTLGQATSSDITTDLSKPFIECVKKVVSRIQFPKPNKNFIPHYDYALTIMSYE